MELSASEIRRHERFSGFTATHTRDGTLWLSWVHTRGRMQAESTDGGQDLIVMPQGGFPRVVHSGKGLTGAIFSPDGVHFLVSSAQSLLLGSTADLDAPLKPWLKPPEGETFTDRPSWSLPEIVLTQTSGGSPKRARVYATAATAQDLAATGTAVGSAIFTAENGGSLLSYDHSPTAPVAAIVHRKANAMLAEVVMVSGLGGDPAQLPEVVAIDGRVEYCKPQVAFLADGRLLARLNLVQVLPSGPPSQGPEGGLNEGSCLREVDPNEASPPPVQHGLYLLSMADKTTSFFTIDVMQSGRPDKNDVCSSSYGGEHNMGVREGFVLSPDRCLAAISARGYSSMKDEIWALDTTSLSTHRVVGESAGGCHVPVCFDPSNSALVFHYRSPVEWGDLWITHHGWQQHEVENTSRLTHSMPAGLKAKLSSPMEVCIDPSKGLHGLLYTPLEVAKGETKLSELQPVVWPHGGPMTVISYDYNPLFNWLASLGYIVCVPNFRGSTGFGVPWMDVDLAHGCGSADLADCFAAAKYLKAINSEGSGVSIKFHEDDASQPDISRGVAVVGHSWGGYMALMCMTCPFGPRWAGFTSDTPDPQVEETPDLMFTCGIAMAGIANWFVQQRETEVRYYDFALMGGWVYHPEIAARARARSPLTHAGNLRAPLLILHGDKDIDVPFSQIGPFAEAAKRSSHAGAAATLVTYPGEGHGISGTAAQKDVLKQIRDFLRINLKPWNFTDNPHGDLTAY